LDWLIDRLDLRPGETLLDCGAGVGGPAAYAAAAKGIRPVLLEPQAGGCRAARSLFGFPAARADAAELPVKDHGVDAAWALGVLCTTKAQLSLLSELRRVARPPGRIGLLVLVAREAAPAGEPDDSFFPTAELLDKLLQRSGLRVDESRDATDIWAPPAQWQQRIEKFEAAMRARYADEKEWQVAEEQSERIANLLQRSAITPQLLSLRHSTRPEDSR
jgi:ubiquinone/menaquinone biosynthesis C-methylase UbiE